MPSKRPILRHSAGRRSDFGRRTNDNESVNPHGVNGPEPIKSDAIAAEVDPERKVKLSMAQQMKIKGLQKTIIKRPTRNRLVRYRSFLRGE